MLSPTDAEGKSFVNGHKAIYFMATILTTVFPMDTHPPTVTSGKATSSQSKAPLKSHIIGTQEPTFNIYVSTGE